MGLLWALTGWLSTFLLPKAAWKVDVFSVTGKQLAHLPVEVIVAVSLVLIYIMGIFLEALALFVRRTFGVIVILGATLVGALAILGLVSHLGNVVIFVLALAILLAFLRHRRLRPGTSLSNALEDTLLLVFLSLERGTAKALNDVHRMTESDTEIFNLLVKDELRKYFQVNEQFLHQAVHRLDAGQTYRAAIAMGVTIDEVCERATPEERSRLLRLKTMDDLRLARRGEEDPPADLKEVLLDKLRINSELRISFAESVLDFSNLRDLLRRRLERVDLLLRYKYPEIYADYDRVKAEGEFRSAVAIPLVALVVTASYNWHLRFNAHHGLGKFWWLCLAAAAVGGIVAAAGATQTKRSKRILYNAVVDKLVEIDDSEAFSESVFVFKPAASFSRTDTARHVAKEITAERWRRGWAYLAEKFGRRTDRDRRGAIEPGPVRNLEAAHTSDSSRLRADRPAALLQQQTYHNHVTLVCRHTGS
ncbi:hypothetical protein GCM10010399_94480 [Dactylosporangium fulvum]